MAAVPQEPPHRHLQELALPGGLRLHPRAGESAPRRLNFQRLHPGLDGALVAGPGIRTRHPHPVPTPTFALLARLLCFALSSTRPPRSPHPLPKLLLAPGLLPTVLSSRPGMISGNDGIIHSDYQTVDPAHELSFSDGGGWLHPLPYRERA